MAKIIIAAPPITGEVAPLLGIGRELAERGHRITVLTGSRFRAGIEADGLAFTPLTGTADFDDRRLDETFSERATLTPGPEQLVFDFANIFINPMPEQYAALQALLDDDPDQFLIANSLFLGAWPTALGSPGRRPRGWVTAVANPLALSSEDTTFFGPVPVEPGADQKAANRAANAEFAGLIQPAQDRLVKVLRSLGATESCPLFIDGLVTMADETAALTVPGFEFERGDAPDSLSLVGILPAPHQADWRPPSWWAELDGTRPVVVVTQGTLANADLSQLVEPALTGLAGLDVTVVAALGRDVGALSIPVPPNARVTEYIPFGALLPKADVFVTNGGFGSTQQAIAAGVPVVVAGATEEKPMTAARVAFHGLGIDLRTGTPTAEAVADATQRLLKDTEIHENVLRLAAVYAAHDAIAEIERLIVA